MTAQQGFDLCDRVLALVGDRAAAVVTCGQGTNALTRFANSRIHQNMAGDDRHVRLRIIVDGGRIAQASTTAPRRRRARAARGGHDRRGPPLPPDPEYPGLAEPAPVADVDHYDPDTAAASPDARAEVVADFVGAGPDLESAGYCSTDADTHVLCSTTGLRYASRSTTAQVDGIHRAAAVDGPPTDGYGQTTSKRIADLDGRLVGERRRRQGHERGQPDRARPGHL